MNIQRAINEGTKYLCDFEIQEPKHICKILLAFLLKKDTTYIVIHQDEEINDNIIQSYKIAIEKISKGVPVQYITNEQSFMGLKFYVDENVLIPQPDTEILVEEVLEIAKKENKLTTLDLCTGSGAIGVSISKYLENSSVTASDISKNALEIAQKNAKTYTQKIEFILSNLFENINEKFDIIVSNPPYIETKTINSLSKEVQNEPHIALDGGEDGLEFYRKIIKEAKKYLNQDGYLAVEIGYNQKEKVIELFKQNGYTQIYSKKDLGKNDRIVVGKY